ncbi:MAG: hypothetical protein ACXU86_06770 [Archangium sp.]
MDVPASLQDFSLIRGGPFPQLQQRLHFVPSKRPLPRWRLLALMGLGWLPLLLLAALRGEAALRALLRDIPIHVQMLVSLPLLIAAAPYVDSRLALTVRQFVSSELVAEDGLHALDAAAREATRLRSQWRVEAGLLLLAYALSFAHLPGGEQHLGWLTAAGEDHPTLAGGWYLAVSRPLFRFVVLWWLWCGTVWTHFLFRLSRRPLALRATHPDYLGGLRFLCNCQGSFSIIVFALACTVATATWQMSRSSPTEDFLRYASPLLILALVSLVLLFAPLGFFCGQLARTKRLGELHFSALASLHSRDFERKWFAPQDSQERGPDVPTEEILGSPDVSSLIDLGSSFDVTHRMRLFPWSRRPMLAVIIAALAPLAPLLMMNRQFLELLLQLARDLL